MGTIDSGWKTHTGLQRVHNEDSLAAEPDLGLWVVADGMGGHEHGEVASELARETIVNEVRAGRSLADGLAEANRRVFEASHDKPSRLPMGTTVAAAHLNGNECQIAWVGDSRVYLWNDGALKQLTEDHSYVQELVQKGLITSAQARRHPQRNVVTQALGVSKPESIQAEHCDLIFQPGMRLLLCSDGLTEEVDDETIAGILADGESAQATVERLVQAALDGGGSDNVSVIVVDSH